MRFVPFPSNFELLWKARKDWMPFIPDIAKRSGESVEQLIDRVRTGYTQIGLVFDEDDKPCALVGMQYTKRGEELVGEIVWMTGRGMKQWRGLLPELHRYLKEHKHCAVIRPICRPGWSRWLNKEFGYKTTHIVMEHAL